MKLLVIGHSVLDKIFIKDEIKIQPGGIYYSVKGFASAADPGDELYLLTSMDIENRIYFKDIFSKVNSDFIQETDSIPKVNLHLSGSAERCEGYENLTNKLEITNWNMLNNFDGIFINMITGFDIDLSDLKNIRENFKGKIFLDVHTLSRGYDEKSGKREFRVIPGAEKWINFVDIIQVNENELFSLSDEKEPEKIIKKVLDLGAELLIVTKGKGGAEVFYRDESGLQQLKEKAIEVETKNSVGCGDIFGSAFFYIYIKTYNVEVALKFANRAAGISASYESIDEFKELRNDIFGKFD